jgi:hypothetical protein
MHNLPTPRFPRPDWREELRLRELEARAAREAVATEEVPAPRPPPHREPVETGVALPALRPNLEEVKAWQAQQVKAARP